ncbi:MAG: hypothetical protein QM296_05460 [Bacillota bacterium]|nr:hypothetical protein [Bacillota bacterium]
MFGLKRAFRKACEPCALGGPAGSSGSRHQVSDLIDKEVLKTGSFSKGKLFERKADRSAWIPADHGSGNIEKFAQTVYKKVDIAPRIGQYRKNVHTYSLQLAEQHRRFLFFFHVDHKAAANESIGSSRAGDKC